MPLSNDKKNFVLIMLLFVMFTYDTVIYLKLENKTQANFLEYLYCF